MDHGTTPLTDAESLMSFACEDWSAWQAVLAAQRSRLDARWAFEQAWAMLETDDLFDGWCPLCEKRVRFAATQSTTPGHSMLRESLVCPGCSTNARMRAGMALLVALAPSPDAQVYITEQASPSFVWLQKRYRNAHGSEYGADPELTRGLRQYLHDLGGAGEIRAEDVTKLTFADASLDAIGSFDVLEHVPDYRAALREFARPLKPGGSLVLTAPLLHLAEASVERARVNADGSVEHLLPPEFHGDPLSGDGILCFHHFGWDLTDHARAAGFRRARMVMPWSPHLGLSANLWTLVAER